MRKHVAVVGSGVSGLSAAWLLARNGVQVTLLEADSRPGGHSNTVVANFPGSDGVAVDTGFIVFNHATYPNLTALLQHLGVQTHATDMSFAVSGRFEYAGHGINGLLSQRSNLLRPAFWRMVRDIRRFYDEAVSLDIADDLSLLELLATHGYSQEFSEHHLLPMAAAIWSTEVNEVGHMQARAFVEFFSNHGLLQLRDRPKWHTVKGGSIEYVNKLLATPGLTLELNQKITSISRTASGVDVMTSAGTRTFDDVILATHANTALQLLDQPTDQETKILTHFDYTPSRAYLHTDQRLMPKKKRAWASWNYLDRGNAHGQALCVTYWMNRLQHLPTSKQLFVTLNPPVEPDNPLAVFDYDHPVLNTATAQAQTRLWELQGQQNTWFCGAYFGHGFHEDGLQAGLAVAEAISGASRPWQLDNPNSRICVSAIRDQTRIAA
jgi:uncharacterized protein